MNLFKKIHCEINSIAEFLICSWPESYIGTKLRKSYWAKRICCTNITMLRNAKITNPELMVIGDNFLAGEQVIIDPNDSKGIFIGKNVALALRTYIRAANHIFNSFTIPIIAQGHDSASILHQGREYSVVIEDEVWVGANAIILSGTHIGKGSIIAAGSVIASQFPPYSIVAGNPGRVIGNRQKQSQRETEHG